MFLPDINSWLALTFESHFHHGAARKWFETHRADGFSFCRYADRLSSAKAFGEEAVTLREGWRFYDAIVSDSQVAFL